MKRNNRSTYGCARICIPVQLRPRPQQVHVCPRHSPES
jgi:hypothetical protein